MIAAKQQGQALRLPFAPRPAPCSSKRALRSHHAAAACGRDAPSQKPRRRSPPPLPPASAHSLCPSRSWAPPSLPTCSDLWIVFILKVGGLTGRCGPPRLRRPHSCLRALPSRALPRHTEPSPASLSALAGLIICCPFCQPNTNTCRNADSRILQLFQPVPLPGAVPYGRVRRCVVAGSEKYTHRRVRSQSAASAKLATSPRSSPPSHAVSDYRAGFIYGACSLGVVLAVGQRLWQRRRQRSRCRAAAPTPPAMPAAPAGAWGTLLTAYGFLLGGLIDVMGERREEFPGPHCTRQHWGVHSAGVLCTPAAASSSSSRRAC